MKYHFMTDMDEHINQLFHDRRMTDNQLLMHRQKFQIKSGIDAKCSPDRQPPLNFTTSLMTGVPSPRQRAITPLSRSFAWRSQTASHPDDVADGGRHGAIGGNFTGNGYATSIWVVDCIDTGTGDIARN